ncbi:hypothetical protein CFE70_005060 [Pyrenophora teres f. teres 0-1]
MTGSALFRSIAQSTSPSGRRVLVESGSKGRIMALHVVGAGSEAGSVVALVSVTAYCRRGMEQTLIICSLHGLFWAADGHVSSPTQQAGHYLPCRVGPPFESGVMAQCSCIAARDCHGFSMASQSTGGPARQREPISRCKECRAQCDSIQTTHRKPGSHLLQKAQSRHCHHLLAAYLISSTPERVRINITRSASPAYPQILSIRRQISILAEAATVDYYSTPHRFIWQTAAEPCGRASALTEPQPPSEAQRQLIEDPALCRLNPQIALKRTSNGVLDEAREPITTIPFRHPFDAGPGTRTAIVATSTPDARSSG